MLLATRWFAQLCSLVWRLALSFFSLFKRIHSTSNAVNDNFGKYFCYNSWLDILQEKILTIWHGSHLNKAWRGQGEGADRGRVGQGCKARRVQRGDWPGLSGRCAAFPRSKKLETTSQHRTELQGPSRLVVEVDNNFMPLQFTRKARGEEGDHL